MAYDGSGRRMSKTRMRKAMRRSASPKFEWYLKNHLGSTMLVYGTSAYDVFD